MNAHHCDERNDKDDAWRTASPASPGKSVTAQARCAQQEQPARAPVYLMFKTKGRAALFR
jgi:hypothetical protein